MKQHISLYIADKLADLSSESIIQMNYQTEELLNPTVVKNSYSQQVTLPGTANNNAIFGQIYRFDSNITSVGGATGTQFSPLVRTPFVIYSESGEILERGYLKLDSIERNGAGISYAVTLYGGLGSLLYQLSYKEEEDGEKLTLADLSYDAGGKSDVGLDFNISVNTVGLAWNTISDNGGLPEKFDVLNFAPAYNGIPDSGFSADKAVSAADAFSQKPLYSIKTSVTQDGKTYGLVKEDSKDSYGYTLLDLGKERTEWQTKDLRSYLQRPVISVRKIFEAMRKRASNWGMKMNLDPAFFNENNPYYDKTWLLLPSMSTLELEKVDKTISMNAPYFTDSDSNVIDGECILSESIPEGTTSTISCTMYRLHAFIKTARRDITLLSLYTPEHVETTENGNIAYINSKERAWFIQMYAKDKNGQIVGASNVYTLLAGNSTFTATSAAKKAKFTPLGTGSFEEARKSCFIFNMIASEGYPKSTYGYLWDDNESMSFELTGSNVAHVYMRITRALLTTTDPSPEEYYARELDCRISENQNSVTRIVSTPGTLHFSGNTDIESWDGARTGSLIQKAILLNTGNSVADYLLSYCKMFGLMLVYDKDDQAVNVMSRNTFYAGGQTIDISDRIDRSQKITTKPFEFDARTYELGLEYGDGKFAKQYDAKYGRAYGLQRINTNYAFNSESKELLDNVIFKGACEVKEQSPYFTNLTETVDGQKYIVPSIFIDGNITYKLYANDGSTTELNAQSPTILATMNDNIYFDPTYKGYDWFSKMQFHDDEEKALDIQDVLLFYTGSASVKPSTTSEICPYENFHLTDDLPIMSTLNEGKPCWILPPFAGIQANFTLPKFGRYITENGKSYSLDMGAPSEIDQPDATFDPASTIYARCWQKYMSDRYDLNSRVVSCQVDFRGIKVGEDLLRNFYYFDNAIWVLNKITNYTITEEGPVECEFVKVQNIENYTNGQNY